MCRIASGGIFPSEVRVPVASAAGFVLRIVAVDEVDPAGDPDDALDDVREIFTGRMRVACVEAEARP